MNQELLKKIDEVIEEAGWDQPHCLYGIRDGKFVKIAEFLGHPLVELPEIAIAMDKQDKNSYEAIILSIEGWSYPDEIIKSGISATKEVISALYEIVPPSKHPDRVEIRNVFCASKEGEYSYTKKRGGEVLFNEKLADESQLEGSVPDAIRLFAKEALK